MAAILPTARPNYEMPSRHQLRRGYWPPFTVTALRVRPWRLTGHMVSLDTILTDGGRRCESVRKLGALDGVVVGGRDLPRRDRCLRSRCAGAKQA